MRKLKWFAISVALVCVVSCQSTAQKENSGQEARNADATVTSPLQQKIERFYSLFTPMPSGELNCDDLLSKASLSKEMVMEYVNAEVRNWSDEEWNETTYNAVFAAKKKDYFVFAIEREVPGASSIMLNTYDLNGMRQSSIPICEESPGGEIESRIGEDLSIFRMDEYGISTFKLNARGVYVKGN